MIDYFVQQRLQGAGSKAATLMQIAVMFSRTASAYVLEGDGEQAWKCYEQLIFIQNSVSAVNLPNLTALSMHISGGIPVVVQQCYQYGVAAVHSVWDYTSLRH